MATCCTGPNGVSLFMMGVLEFFFRALCACQGVKSQQYKQSYRRHYQEFCCLLDVGVIVPLLLVAVAPLSVRAYESYELVRSM